MSHTRVKTEYEVEGSYASTEKRTLYCWHNHSCDCTTFYNENGTVADMAFCDWTPNDKWAAMQRLWAPHVSLRSNDLIDGVEYYHGEPWTEKPQK